MQGLLVLSAKRRAGRLRGGGWRQGLRLGVVDRAARVPRGSQSREDAAQTEARGLVGDLLRTDAHPLLSVSECNGGYLTCAHTRARARRYDLLLNSDVTAESGVYSDSTAMRPTCSSVEETATPVSTSSGQSPLISPLQSGMDLTVSTKL